MVLSFAERVLKIKRIHSELIWIDNNNFIGHTLCDPVMTAYRFKPLDLVLVIKCYAVRLVSPVFFKEFRKP